MADKAQQVEIFKEGIIISVDFSLPFFHRIQQMLLGITNEHKIEDVKSAVDKIKKGNQSLLPWEENLETLMILINTVEDKARADGSLEIKPLPEHP